jgi:BirA family biotin operon repressor/biotin-[acetyl-CoA-carboxylase] ligase
MNAEATRVRYAVVGIGINVNQPEFPDELAGTATSLRRETGRAWSRVELTAALLKSLDREYARLGGDPHPSKPKSGLPGTPDSREIIAHFEAACSTARGARVRVEENGGFEGITEGLDERGFLRVRTESGMRTVLSGGVRPLTTSH